MSIKNLEIKPSEAKAVEVASLPTRPTSSATYGGRGLTAQQMKAAYDAYPALIKERFNALIADLLSGSALEDIPFTIPTHDPFGTGIESTVKAYLEYIGKILDFANDSTDDSYKTVHEFVNTVVNDMANATTLDYDKNTRVLTLTIDGFEKAVTIEVDKYEKAIQQLNEQVAYLEATKFDKAGGGISGDVNIGGDVSIGGDLYVAGNSSIQEAGHLKIKDAVIITNSDGKKLAVLSGLAIRKGENDTGVDETYGIMYDFASNSVKLGLIYTDENGNYQFLAGEGQPVATRADSAELAEHGIALWDAANHRFIAKDMTDLDLTHGDTTVDYNTTDGMTINGQARFTYNGGTTKDVTMDIEIPIVAGDGILIDKKAGADEQVEIKADTDTLSSSFMPRVGSGEIPAVNYSGEVVGKYYGPFSGGIPTYSDDDVGEDTGGNFLYAMTTGSENLGDSDKSKFRLTNKQYVDDGFVQKVTVAAVNADYVYIAKGGGGQGTLRVADSGLASSVVKRQANGNVTVASVPYRSTDAVCFNYVKNHYLALTGGTITGSLTIAQDLIVQGKTTSKDVENLAVKENLITLAKDNTAALTAPAGMMVPKYNGIESGALVFDNTGTAYVGDVALTADGNIDVTKSDLQPLATRGTLVSGNLVKWDADRLTLVDSGKKIDDFVEKVTVTSGSNLAYIAKNDGTQSTIPIAQMPYQNTVAQRGEGGTLKVGTPVDINDATHKAYVDAQTVYTHYITITNENYDGMILLTIPAKIAEPFSDLTQLGNKLADIEKPIMATGYLHNKSEASGESTATVYGITFDGSEQSIKALLTYQTFALTDQTITATTTSSWIFIKDDGLWTFTDYVE